jgi:hypothetical protein
MKKRPRPSMRAFNMKYAALGLLCLLVLLPVSAVADSLDSISPSSFMQYTPEQSATLTGVNLFGNIYGDPDENNIFSSTHLLVDGPAGTFEQPISGGGRDPVSGTDTIYMSIFDGTLAVPGHYSVMVIAQDDGGYRAIGPVYYDVVALPPPAAQNPFIFVPEPIFAEATSLSGANVSFSVGGFSFVNPPPAPTITCDHNSGDLFPIGETIVNCTATDSFGSASAGFPIFVQDVGSPVVTVPADIITGNPVVTFTASAVDAVNGSVPVTCDPASGSTFPIGTTVVFCYAYDAQLNLGMATFNVTVTNGPVLTLPANIVVECTGSAGTPVSFTVTATDNATISCTPASGSAFPLGTTTVNCTATASTDPTPTTSGSFTVTVGDTTPPQISGVTATPNSLWPPDKTMRAVTIGVSIVDVCSSNPAGGCQIISVSSNEPDGTTQWQITGPLTLNLKADRFGTHVPGTAPGSGGRVYTITVRCTDGSGNATTRTVVVTVPHDHGN